MIDWSSYLVSNIMVVNVVNVHYYERYVNSPIPWMAPWNGSPEFP